MTVAITTGYDIAVFVITSHDRVILHHDKVGDDPFKDMDWARVSANISWNTYEWVTRRKDRQMSNIKKWSNKTDRIMGLPSIVDVCMNGRLRLVGKSGGFGILTSDGHCYFILFAVFVSPPLFFFLPTTSH